MNNLEKQKLYDDFTETLNQVRMNCDSIEDYEKVLLDNGLVDISDYE